MEKRKDKVVIWWMRRDLRIHDNAALNRALQTGLPVLPFFVFDTNILDQLPNRRDDRVLFIFQSLNEIQTKLVPLGSSIETFHGRPNDAFRFITEKYEVKAVFCNNDYEAYARERDVLIGDFLSEKGIPFHSFKDHVIFEKKEVVKDSGEPYTVFTPYSRKWMQRFQQLLPELQSGGQPGGVFFQRSPQTIPSPEEIGFENVTVQFPAFNLTDDLLANYETRRDFPAMQSTSRIGVHLRFGTVSIRDLAVRANQQSGGFLNELIWRDFYQMILWNFPHVGRGEAFRREYDRIEWRNNEAEFEKWTRGETGYPLVDAGMRELNETGFMHNRVRMVVASFLAKHLLIDWRWGESWFASKLLDFDFAANNGGWQWAAGCGCDAAPYFRIFNPALQMKKFDPELRYVRKWVPEFGTTAYPHPMVDHAFARERCLETYKAALREF